MRFRAMLKNVNTGNLTSPQFFLRDAATKTPQNVQENYMKHDMCLQVDEKDNVIGVGSKKDCHLLVDGTSALHRAFSLFLFRKLSSKRSVVQLLIQRRAFCKLTYPGLWSNTCCSHPLANILEEHEAMGNLGVKLAARRKLKHELGIDAERFLPVANIHYLGRILYFALNEFGDPSLAEHEVDYILIGTLDAYSSSDAELVHLNSEEVSEAHWVEEAELDKHLQSSMVKPQDSVRSEPLKRLFTPWFRRLYTSGYLSEIWTQARVCYELTAPNGYQSKLRLDEIVRLPP